MSEQENKYTFSKIGIIFGFIALGLAILPPELITQPDNSQTISESLLEIGKDLVGIKKEPPIDHLKPYKIGSIIFAVVGLLLGVVSWIRREDRRAAIASVVLAITALAWSYILLGVLIAVVLVIIGGMGIGA